LKRYTKLGLSVLLLAVALILASCGVTQGSGGSESDGDMQGMDHGGNTGMEKTGGMSGMGDMEGMDHGSGGMASGMLMENGKYSDRRFIDAMIPHHQSAIEMAQVALEESDNSEIRELAENIISAQQEEIEQMSQWREEWYPQS
jgi:uncharacterized protein (DUF305 family)